MLNKIKTLVVVLVCMIVCGLVSTVVKTVGLDSKEAEIVEVKSEIAAVEAEEEAIVERLEAGCEAEEIEAVVKVIDMSSYYRFVYGMSIDYAASEGIKDGSIVYCINHTGNGSYCVVRYNSENNMVEFKTIEDLEEELSSDKFLVIQLSIFIIFMGALSIATIFFIIDSKKDMADFEAYLKSKNTIE